VLLTKILSTAAAAALTFGVTAGVSYGAGDVETATTTAPTASTGTTSDTATATIRVQASNVTITALSVSDTATSTITVRDVRRGTAPVTWDVPAGVRTSGHFKRLSDLRVGFTIHLSGTRTGSAAPVAHHVVAPGRNKKVELRSLTVAAVNGAAGTITVRDKKGTTSTWAVRRAKVEGKAKRLGDLSRGDVVSLRGETVAGSGRGTASIVRVEKDVKPAKAKPRKK
jgi:hypothetical protein